MQQTEPPMSYTVFVVVVAAVLLWLLDDAAAWNGPLCPVVASWSWLHKMRWDQPQWTHCYAALKGLLESVYSNSAHRTMDYDFVHMSNPLFDQLNATLAHFLYDNRNDNNEWLHRHCGRIKVQQYPVGCWPFAMSIILPWRSDMFEMLHSTRVTYTVVGMSCSFDSIANNVLWKVLWKVKVLQRASIAAKHFRKQSTSPIALS